MAESLEGRRLLTAIDLTTTQTSGLGVVFVGKATNNTAGYTVTDVGNVTGSGYDSFVVSATGLPGQALNIGGKTLTFTAASESAAYLVFGSKTVNSNTVSNWLNLTNGVAGTTGELTSGQRAGDLGELGTLGVAAQSGTTNPTAQTNPTVAQPQPPLDTSHVYGFNFDGLTLVTGLDTATGLGRNSALGFSVTPLGDVNNDGFSDFAISAPNDSGGGRVFVVYGGAALATQSTTTKTVDLEPTAGATSTTTPTKVVSFSLAGGTTGTDVGFSVGGIGNYFGNGSSTKDLAIGVPGATINGVANAGAVFAVSGNYINSLGTGTNVDLTTLSNGTNTTGGIEYTGNIAGGEVGFSVSTAGNFSAETATNGTAQDDLLIGAPGSSGGLAYLVYGKQSYLPNQQLGSAQSLAMLGVAPVSTPVQTNPLQGVVFGDLTPGDLFGFSVSTAGDFNADGAGDIMIGAPGYATSTGYVTVVYGRAGTATTTTSTRINSPGLIINPTAATAGITTATFLGQGIDNYAGYSIASAGHIQFGTATTAAPSFDILIGAPGALIQTAYLIPGTAAGATARTGSLNLANTNTTLGGNTFTVSGTSNPAISNGGSGFATSVSARNLVVDPNRGSTTVDSDNVPDLFFGAPFSSLSSPINPLTTTRSLAGAAYVVEGGLIGGTASGGGGGGGTGGTSSSVTTSFNVIVNSLLPVVFTGSNNSNGQPNPPLSALSHLISYAPLPVQVAYQQFLPQPGFLARENAYHHPSLAGNFHQAPSGTALNVPFIRHSENKYLKVNTLKPEIFRRGKTKIGRVTTFTHHSKVIPRNQQTESYPG